MTTIKRLLTFMTCLFSTFLLTAQLSLSISNASGNNGEMIEVGVSISGFQNITSMQFSINWDSTVLDFKSVNNLTEELPSFTEREIGLVEAPSGAIRVAWFDNTIQGISIPDSTQLFTIQFEVLGEPGMNSQIAISDSPIVIEFTSLDGATVELSDISGGMISVPEQSTSLTYVTAPNGMVLQQNEPNPFKNTTVVTAILPAVEQVQFYITDVSGKIIYQTDFQSVIGENMINIERHLFDAPGTYYYTVRGEQYQLSRKMILLP